MRLVDFGRKLCRRWPHQWLGVLLDRWTAPVPFGLWLINVVAQRIFRLNGRMAWMVHFTSCVVGGDLEIGKNVWRSLALSGGCYIQCGNGIRIGDDTIFGPGVKIISANHDKNCLDRWVPGPPVKIGKGCWIGANAVILPGTELGDNVIVGAGAVVNKSFPNNAVIAGVPAKQIAARAGDGISASSASPPEGEAADGK